MSLIIKVTLSYGDLIVLGGPGHPARKEKMNQSLLSTPKHMNVFNRYCPPLLLCLKFINAKLKLLHIRESNTVLDSGFHTIDSDSRYWIPVFVSGTRILDSNLLVRFRIPWIPDSMSKIFPDSGFHKQTFPAFWNPDFLTRGDWKLKTSNLLLNMCWNHTSVLFSYAKYFL